MTFRRLVLLSGSAALHAAAIAGVLALAASVREPPPLFVDLTGGPLPGAERAAAAASPRGRGSAVPPVRETPQASPRLPPAPAAPAPAPPAETTPAPASSFVASREAVTHDEGTGPPRAIADGVGGSDVASAAARPSGQPSAAGGGAALAAVGPGPGRGEVPPEFGPYLARFRQRIQELVVYPLAARRRGLAGRVEVEMLLEPSGRVRDVAVIASSSHALLDEAALEAVRALEPLPLPEQLPRRALRVRLPVIFQLQ